MAMMKFLYLFLFTTTFSAAWSQKTDGHYFKDMKGCFLLYNLKTHTFDKLIGDEHCRQRLPACSTFKVPLAVMAFDSGVLTDENVVLKWNGVKESREVLNQDHNAKSWMKDSVVWFSQRITPELGKEKFQNYLTDFNYGNKDFSQGITTAWLVSPSEKNLGLRISAYEQVEFFKKLWADKLPVSKRAMQLTRKITYLETSPKGFKLYGKTGSNFYDKAHTSHLGWFIAYIEKDNQKYITVTNLSDSKHQKALDYGGPRAKEMTKIILSNEGLW